MSADQLIWMGDQAFARGKYREALSHYSAAARLRPDSADVRLKLGSAYRRHGQPALARTCLADALRLQPDLVAAHQEMALACLASGEIDAAMHHARRVADLSPANVEAGVFLASVMDAGRKRDAAWEILDALLRAGIETTSLAVLYARLARHHGSDAAALTMVLGRLRARADLTPGERSTLHFSAVYLLDRAGRFDEAFEHATQAHALRKSAYDPARTERIVRDWTRYFSRSTLRGLPRATHRSQSPVFIVGMPRSGTTLVEQIIASHPAAFGAGELTWVFELWDLAVQRRSDPGASLVECVERLTATDVEELAAEYLGPLAALCPAARRITDKLPMNLMNLGLIAMLFPQARVIYCRRDPLDTCLSCFLTDFDAGRAFNFDLASAGHLLRQCETLMSHWRRVLDLPILEVRYENVVSDLDREARRIIDFLGLPWNERCLRFHETPRWAATASQWQVQMPIYCESVGRWRHYRRHLAPLRQSLAGTKWRRS